MNDFVTRKAAIPLKPVAPRRPTQAEVEEDLPGNSEFGDRGDGSERAVARGAHEGVDTVRTP